MLLFAVRSLAPPHPLPADAPADEFSAARAAHVLSYLLGDESPHPVGSPANQAVRDRLMAALRDLGLRPEVQRTVGCSGTQPVCAIVENVVAEIPGETTDALALMSHYDSVPHAPGAADDGSGVATVLETARALTAGTATTGPERRNRILLLFTDAEEMGLLGAEAFFAEHPWRQSVKAVINIEGSGSGGPSLLLRSSSAGGHLLRAYQRTASAPVAFSYAQEVFARMPNDTDYTVPDRAGIPGIDFAFAFEFNHYHTPLDTLANLDRGTLQHHGSNVLPLARELAGADLSRTAPAFSYQTVQQRLWLTWPASWTVGLALLGLFGLGAAAVSIAREETVRGMAGGFGLGILAIVLGLAGCYAALAVADLLLGTRVRFPASFWPWRLLMAAGALLPVSLLACWARGRPGFWPRYLGVWTTIGILALIVAVTAPLAANLLIVPLLVAAILAVLARFALDADSRMVRASVGCLSVAGIAWLLLGIAFAMEQTQGLILAPAIFTNLVLVAAAFLPFRSGAAFNAVLAVALVAGWVWAAASPLYSPWRPQHVSVYYVLDLDEQRAQWLPISENPLPVPLLAALGGSPDQAPIAPWLDAKTTPAAPAPPAKLTAPAVLVERVGDHVRVVLQSRESGDFARLILPADAGIDDFRMAGRALTLSERNGYLQARFFANGREPLVFEFSVRKHGNFTGYVLDGSYRLPAVAAPLIAARGRLAVPQHQGDGRIAFQRIRF